MAIIEDGKGSGVRAEVDDENRLKVFSNQNSLNSHVSRKDEGSYVFSHDGYISMTTLDTETGILHIRNDSTTKDMYIVSIRTCGNVINKWKLYKNSTGGTLIGDQTLGNAQNINVKSNSTAEATVYKGADGKTVSGGSMIGHLINDVGHSDEAFDGALILGRNDSIQLSVEVSAAGQICCRVIAFYND